jgi:hypothetical protein
MCFCMYLLPTFGGIYFSRLGTRFGTGRIIAQVIVIPAEAQGSPGKARTMGCRLSYDPQVVLRGLDPRIHAFVSAPRSRGWPGRARPRRSHSADLLTCSAAKFSPDSPAQAGEG